MRYYGYYSNVSRGKRKEEEAGLALAVALQFQEGGPGVLYISFLTGLVRKSIAFYLSQSKPRESEEPSLTVSLKFLATYPYLIERIRKRSGDGFLAISATM